MRSIYSNLNHDFFDEVSCSSEYLIGYIYTDGTVDFRSNYITFKLQEKDVDLLYKIKSLLDIKHDIIYSSGREEILGRSVKTQRLARLHLHSSKICNYLLSRNIVSSKSFREEFPIAHNNYFYDFLRGFLDGDGCVYVDRGKWLGVYFVSSNLGIIEYIRLFIQEDIGVKSNANIVKNIKNGITYKNGYKIVYCGVNAVRILNRIYNTENIELKLERKYDKYFKIKLVCNKSKIYSNQLLELA